MRQRKITYKDGTEPLCKANTYNDGSVSHREWLTPDGTTHIDWFRKNGTMFATTWNDPDNKRFTTSYREDGTLETLTTHSPAPVISVFYSEDCAICAIYCYDSNDNLFRVIRYTEVPDNA